jgi:hypothetical protein
MSEADGGLLPQWKAGDKAVAVKVSNGYVYLNEAAAQYFRADLPTDGVISVTVV